MIYRLCRLAEKLILRAKDEELAGDEEQAYVLYMRFVDVVKAVRGSKEFKKDKKYFNDLLPTRRISDALDSAERLSASLKKRYEGAHFTHPHTSHTLTFDIHYSHRAE